MGRSVNELNPKSNSQQLLSDCQRRDVQREEENVQKTMKGASKRDDIGSVKMVMDVDAKDIQSDLYALKRLYGLLKNDGDDSSNTASDSLDEQARLMLKNLLDAAAKRALKLHAEMIAGKMETQLSQSCNNDLVNSDKSKKLDRSDISLWKERSNPQGSRAGNVEQSKQSMVENGPEYQNKCCRICRRNTLKHLDSIKNANFYDVGAQDSNSFFDQNNETGHYLRKSEQEIRSNYTDKPKIEKGPFSSDSSGTVYTDFSSDMMGSNFDEVCNYETEATNKPDELDRVSEEASEAMKQIEQHISAFQIGTKPVNRAPRTQYGAVSRAEMSQIESEGTPTDSYSSNSRSHQTSSVDSDSKEYSSSGQTRNVSPSTSSESQYSSNYTSSSENEVYSSDSQPIERRGGPTYSMSRKSGNEVKRKKQSGTWKRLKDGFAIIFHHHHHHHHHHNRDDNEAKLKYKGKTIRSKRENEEAYGERAVEKAKKAMIREKNKKVQFHGLMEGLLRHVRRSKPSKIGKGQNRKKKKTSLKKSNLLKLLKHHRGAGKAHVKLA